jgi:hypothetical protein
MTTVRTVATHQIVQRCFPRPAASEADELGMAVGRAIDEALARSNHEAGSGRPPTQTAMQRYAAERLEAELREIDLTIAPPLREATDRAIHGVLRAFRGSALFGLPRPKSRLILVNERVGVYAQPDYFDRMQRFYEMKSYRAVPSPPDVALQLTYFQLAYPGWEGVLACFDRHAVPVTVSLLPVPPLAPAAAEEALRRALAVGEELGLPKVLQYVDNPIVRYSVPPGPPEAASGTP